MTPLEARAGKTPVPAPPLPSPRLLASPAAPAVGGGPAGGGGGRKRRTEAELLLADSPSGGGPSKRRCVGAPAAAGSEGAKAAGGGSSSPDLAFGTPVPRKGGGKAAAAPAAAMPAWMAAGVRRPRERGKGAARCEPALVLLSAGSSGLPPAELPTACARTITPRTRDDTDAGPTDLRADSGGAGGLEALSPSAFSSDALHARPTAAAAAATARGGAAAGGGARPASAGRLGRMSTAPAPARTFGPPASSKPDAGGADNGKVHGSYVRGGVPPLSCLVMEAHSLAGCGLLAHFAVEYPLGVQACSASRMTLPPPSPLPPPRSMLLPPAGRRVQLWPGAAAPRRARRGLRAARGGLTADPAGAAVGS